ncbi:hypothetical protein IT401_00670 [Candidatus Nomurabacteria bacterium]|nr:hypothetical protein [Candidatus Nomurabacteria bacterium]
MTFSLFSSKKVPSSIVPAISLKFDPHRYWMMLLSAFFLIFAAALIYFSLAFRQTLRRIDSPATPVLQTNASKIETMNKSLDATVAALEARIGTPAAPSQTGPSVVE